MTKEKKLGRMLRMLQVLLIELLALDLAGSVIFWALFLMLIGVEAWLCVAEEV